MFVLVSSADDVAPISILGVVPRCDDESSLGLHTDFRKAWQSGADFLGVQLASLSRHRVHRRGMPCRRMMTTVSSRPPSKKSSVHVQWK